MTVAEQPMKNLSAALGAGINVESYAGGEGLPVFITAVDDVLRTDLGSVVSWVRDTNEALDRLLSVAGAVVLRGFPITSTADFNGLVEHLPSTEFGYSGGNTRRDRIEGRVFEATALPATEKITLHQEMAYLPHYPSKLAFFCLQPSTTGGETIICDMRRVEKALDPTFVEQVRERGVLYLRNFRAPGTTTGYPILDAFHKTWQEAFFTTDQAVAQEACEDMGLDFEWLPDGSMATSFRTTGFATHSITGAEVWFNHIHAMSFVRDSISDEHYDQQEKFYSASSMIRPFQVRFGDGEPMSESDVRAIYPVLDELTVAFPWESGDVMLVDNILTCHGRNPFTGSRNVQVALIR
jgi:hypothetical protein